MQNTVPFLNIVDPGFRADSEDVERAREVSWYARTPLGIVVLRYHHVVAFLKDGRLHSGTSTLLKLRGVEDGPLQDWWRNVVLNTNGEQHTRLRRLVAKTFTPPSVDALRPFMRATAERLVDAFADAGACEFVEAFADPYPLAVICELLGIPEERRADFGGWAAELSSIFSPDIAALRERVERALAALYACVDEVIAERKRAARDDLVSALVRAEDDGDRLTTEELRSMLVTLVFAGNDTTRNQLGRALVVMAGRSDLWGQLAREPRRAATMVDHIMRIAPALVSSARIVSEDLDIGDLHLPKGTFVQLLLSSGNRDAAVFGEPDPDMERELPEPHLTFGGGMHRCLGMWLARAELEEALRILARRMPNLAPAGEPTWGPGLGIVGPRTVPLAFSR
ncbi:MAG TPA: cytochrome P450 [Candidatus Acidoferrum sp.]|nr:cytochrome P450 [Candidatus Acidoferrum sp.]